MAFGPERQSITAGVHILRLLGKIEAGGGLSITRSETGWIASLAVNDDDQPFTTSDRPTLDDALTDLRAQVIG